MPPSIREPRFFKCNPIGVWTPHDKAYNKESGHTGVTNANMAESRTKLLLEILVPRNPHLVHAMATNPPMPPHVVIHRLLFIYLLLLDKFIVSCPSKKRIEISLSRQSQI
jgi:hypothetical protein